MTPAQLQLARRRLFLGISNVGAWVLAACAGLAWIVFGERQASHPALYLLIAVAALAVQAGFDYLGGCVLMPAPRPTPGEWLRRWGRGVLGHTLLLASIGLASYESFKLTDGFYPALLAMFIGLAIFRQEISTTMVGGVRVKEAKHAGGVALSAYTPDPAFTGGVSGFGRGVSLFPSNWRRELPADELAAETARRQWQTAQGLPGRTLAFVLGWNLLGAALGGWLFGWSARPPAAALFGHVCWMTLWTFASLLLLPSLSRRAVFAADRAAADAGHDPRAWIARFPTLTGEDGGANPAVQAIFYPIPSADRRLARLDRPSGGFVPGNLSRSNLYYSLAGCTPLGRAVHCNVGRPALWVFPPSA